jgi:hypothetical protein
MSVRISQASKTKNCYNPISGHSWTEETPTNSFTIYHCGFEVAKTSSYEKALILKAEWEEFDNKFFK